MVSKMLAVQKNNNQQNVCGKELCQKAQLWKSLLCDLNECVVLKGLCRGCNIITKEKME